MTKDYYSNCLFEAIKAKIKLKKKFLENYH